MKYQKLIFAFSGGKDSIACVLEMIDRGWPVERMELWHSLVDGREGSDLMDYPCTESYVQAFGDHFNIPVYFTWKVGGFEGELLKTDAPTQASKFETPEGVQQSGGTSNKIGSRLKWPAVSADLRKRWCSPYLKIDVQAMALANQDRFLGLKTLFISGERAEESKSREKYKTHEKDRTDNREGVRRARYVDRHRPIHGKSESEVWEYMRRYKINPHPAYRAGWSRLSCADCIFGNKDQFASHALALPRQSARLIQLEDHLGHTIKHKTVTRKGETTIIPVPIKELIAKGTPYAALTPELIEEMNRKDWGKHYTITLDPWEMPAGAFGESLGPV